MDSTSFAVMENYFNYFTEIEEHFCRRRGTVLQLSPLDWALIETWKDSGIPLEAALRGIDSTFDHYERKPSKTKKINGLAWCAQEVLTAAEGMKKAAVGSAREQTQASGQSAAEIAEFFKRNAQTLRQATFIPPVQQVARECATSMEAAASALHDVAAAPILEELERRMTVLEEKLVAALLLSTAEEDLVRFRAEADRAIAPYRSKMPAAQIAQLQKQYIHKRLFERATIPRLSLFYM
ncbi:MAG TPA: hypothetical protein VJN64_02630 [Terriglobales bacterium]|nr:hypothetical protein [Terriglobales bacterium]